MARANLSPGSKGRAAVVSICSNSLLVAVKLVAGFVTGSVAVLTEAIHSAIDLAASLVAFFSIRAADEPADEGHRYGHEKFENVAAAIEGMLILAGSAVIGYQAFKALARGAEVEAIGFGIAVIAGSMVVNAIVSTYLQRRARATGSPALEGDAAHLRSDALTSFAVLLGLVLVHFTGASWLDPVVALLVAAVIVVTGLRLLSRSWRVLVDEALPPDEVALIRAVLLEPGAESVVGFHELRTRQAGTRRYVDLHLQFRAGTSLEEAHDTAHHVQREICDRLQGTDVLIHLEPEAAVRADEPFTAG